MSGGCLMNHHIEDRGKQGYDYGEFEDELGNEQFRHVLIAEGIIEANEKEYLEAWQYLINTKLVWKLQGWFGKTANSLIKLGLCQAVA